MREAVVTKNLFKALVQRETLVEHLTKHLPRLNRIMATGSDGSKLDELCVKAAAAVAFYEAAALAEKRGKLKFIP